ncbi:MAG TPA: MT-A70 family methyltransferase [Jiangellales bacterium]|nr:MT-A70 family methyltransferase [Jiangellales bacterium]
MTPEDAEEYTQALGQVVAGGWRQVALGERLGVPKALGLSTRDWVEQRLGGYVRMNIADRKEAVRELASDDLSQREIADILGVDAATVNRDLKPVASATPEPEPASVTSEYADAPESGVASATPEPEPLDIVATMVAQGLDEKAKAKAKARERVPEPVAEPVPPPPGRYRCIIIDPPWPMQKIERDERPNQGVELDYPVMSLDEIADERHVPVRMLADEDCHIYLWVTHKFMPAGLELLDAWGFNYQCVMTWRKNVGITPYSWMYDTEHVLFGHRGGLKLNRMGLRLSFEAPVQGHSVKPDVFYERVTEASPGPRVEMFARRERDGFVAWGNEVTNGRV